MALNELLMHYVKLSYYYNRLGRFYRLGNETKTDHKLTVLKRDNDRIGSIVIIFIIVIF